MQIGFDGVFRWCGMICALRLLKQLKGFEFILLLKEEEETNSGQPSPQRRVQDDMQSFEELVNSAEIPEGLAGSQTRQW